ncbi:TRI33-like protein [Mya arenaria]|uniref:TRI33-like protein n=1 Tax=Mya arenaria TaxID=6604 RepID=A0ABY7G0R7_MYAAR|nr:uncharacterized protein LOC128220591 [Mya arenaria]WAR28053.1 TRI33-like protein [Mya arenaria]
MAEAVAVHSEGKQLTCSICQRQFREMTVSSCFHTFCLDCLRGHMTPSTPGRGLTTPGRGYTCPLCQSPVILPESVVRHLKKGDTLIPAGTVTRRYSPAVANTCDVCQDGRMALYRCLQCEQSFCNTCTNAHLKMRSSRYHEQQLIPLTGQGHLDDHQEDQKSRLSKYCERHRNDEIKFVCRQCGTLLCIVCKLLEHEGHVTKLVSEEANEIRENLTTLMQKQIGLGERLKMQMRENENRKYQYPQSLDQELSKLNIQATHMHREIDVERDRKENELLNHYDHHIETNNQDLEYRQRDYNDFMAINSEALHLLNEDNDIYVTKKGSYICKRLKEIENETKEQRKESSTPSMTFRSGQIEQNKLENMLGKLSSQPMATHRQVRVLSPQGQTFTRQRSPDGRSLADSLFEEVPINISASKNEPHPLTITPMSNFKLPYSDGIGYVYGIAPVDGDKAWVTMLDSEKVMLVNTHGEVLVTVNVGHIAEDVTDDGKGGCFITCPTSKSVKHIHISGEETVVSSVVENLAQDPHGIALLQYFDDDIQDFFQELYVTFTETRGSRMSQYDNQKGQVRIFTNTGEQLGQSFCLQSPIRIDVAPDSDDMIVSDHSAGCVMICDRAGLNVGGLYKGSENELFKPLGVCFDGFGGVLIADWRAETVTRVTMEGARLGVVVRGLKGPQSVAVKEGILWVGGREGLIQVQRLSG